MSTIYHVSWRDSFNYWMNTPYSTLERAEKAYKERSAVYKRVRLVETRTEIIETVLKSTGCEDETLANQSNQ